MRAHPKAKTADFSRLISVIAGGASVPGELIEWWYKHGLTIRDGYGMTESTASNCLMPTADVPRKIGTSGKTMMYTEMRIMGANDTEVDDGEVGELWMRGPTITPGYWNNDAANKKAFKDGWFMSGDIARRDKEGFITIEDRAKDMYISGGENVYPAEIEAHLGKLEPIAEVAVIGVDHATWGETGCAVAVLKPGHTLTLEALKTHCTEALARYKHPGHLVLVDALPRNATGKVKKFELRESVPKALGL
jgi:fatty-acyl-CoA synthase